MKISRLGLAQLICAAFMLLFAVGAAQAQVAYRAANNARLTSGASGSSITVTKPAGTVSGDVMLASLTVVTNAVTVATPAGWTLITSVNQTGASTSRLYTWYKVAGAAEPATYSWTFTGAHTGAVVGIASFTGVDTTSPIDAFAAQATASSRSHTALSVTSTVAGDMLVTVHEFASSRTWTPPAGMTEFVDRFSRGGTSTAGVALEMNRLALPVAGATGNKTATASGSADRGATISVALRAFVVVATPGDFNIFDTSTPPGSTDGVIKTKVAGAASTVDVVALNPAKTAVLTTFTGAVKVEILNSSDNTGVLDLNGCRPTWTTIQTLVPNPTFVVANNGRITVPFTVAGAYPDARVRVTYPAVGPATKIGCSTDAFAVRPNSFTGLTVSDTNSTSEGTTRTLSNIGAVGGVVHKAGQPFRISAFVQDSAGAGITYTSAAGGYFGNPAAALVTCLLPATCTLGNLDELGAATSWTAGAPAGNFNTTTATYDDAGSFTMYLVDTTFAAVDASDGTPADCSAAGQYICSATINVGRFVPDSFELWDASVLDPDADPSDIWLPMAAPQFRTFGALDASCNAAAPAPRRSFTYVGQSFGYVSVPQFTFKALDANGGFMSNYNGTLMKLTPAGVAQTYTAATGTLNTALALGNTLPPTLNANYTNGNDSPIVGSFAINAADLLSFTRATPVDPFNAVITLSVIVTDSSEIGVAGNGTISSAAPVVFNGNPPLAPGIAFDSLSLNPLLPYEIRFGRLEMQNAHGSQALDLTIPIEVQYCASGCTTAAPIWQQNTSDHCTSLPANRFALGNYNLLTNANMPATNLPAAATVMLRGAANLLLRHPTDVPPSQGSVDVSINLGTTLADVCNPPGFAGPQPAAPPAGGLSYLQGQWCAGGYVHDPVARATFGIYRSKFIYRRENY